MFWDTSGISRYRNTIIIIDKVYPFTVVDESMNNIHASLEIRCVANDSFTTQKKNLWCQKWCHQITLVIQLVQNNGKWSSHVSIKPTLILRTSRRLHLRSRKQSSWIVPIHLRQVFWTAAFNDFSAFQPRHSPMAMRPPRWAPEGWEVSH